MSFLQRSLRWRIVAGFALVLILGFGLASFGAMGLSEMADSVGRMRDLAHGLDRGERMANQLEIIRRGLRSFHTDGSEASLATIVRAETAADKLLADAIAASKGEERRAIYRALQGKMQAFAPERDALVRDYRTAFSERSKLFTGGDALTAASQKLVQAARSGAYANGETLAAKVESSVLMVRVANWRFLATLDRNGPATFETSAAKAKDSIAALRAAAAADLLPLISSVEAALGSYVESFHQVSSSLLSGDKRYEDTIRPALLGMQGDMENAMKLLASDFEENANTSEAQAAWILLLQAIAAGGVTILGIVLAILIGRSLSRPVQAMTDAMARLACDEEDVVIPALNRKDELGVMARAVEVFKRNASEKRQLRREQEEEQAARTRRHAAMDRHTKDFGDSISGVMAGLLDAANRVNAAIKRMSAAAVTTQASARDAAQSSDGSSQDLRTVAVSAEEMAASIQEISRQVTTVTGAVQTTVERAAETNEKVISLASAADQISDVVRLINDIAGKTNLLALNATIEAARAGEAGKGFAVVASEVKALAMQTGKATEEIGTQIVAIRSATEEAVASVREVGVAIGQVEAVASAIAAAVEEQAATTREISNNVQTVTAATETVNKVIEKVLTLAQETSESCQSVLSTADEVGLTATTLRAEVTDFLEAMSEVDGQERRPDQRIVGDGLPLTATVRSVAG